MTIDNAKRSTHDAILLSQTSPATPDGPDSLCGGPHGSPLPIVGQILAECPHGLPAGVELALHEHGDDRGQHRGVVGLARDRSQVRRVRHHLGHDRGMVRARDALVIVRATIDARDGATLAAMLTLNHGSLPDHDGEVCAVDGCDLATEDEPAEDPQHDVVQGRSADAVVRSDITEQSATRYAAEAAQGAQNRERNLAIIETEHGVTIAGRHRRHNDGQVEPLRGGGELKRQVAREGPSERLATVDILDLASRAPMDGLDGASGEQLDHLAQTVAVGPGAAVSPGIYRLVDDAGYLGDEGATGKATLVGPHPCIQCHAGGKSLVHGGSGRAMRGHLVGHGPDYNLRDGPRNPRGGNDPPRVLSL